MSNNKHISNRTRNQSDRPEHSSQSNNNLFNYSDPISSRTRNQTDRPTCSLQPRTANRQKKPEPILTEQENRNIPLQHRALQIDNEDILIADAVYIPEVISAIALEESDPSIALIDPQDSLFHDENELNLEHTGTQNITSKDESGLTDSMEQMVISGERILPPIQQPSLPKPKISISLINYERVWLWLEALNHFYNECLKFPNRDDLFQNLLARFEFLKFYFQDPVLINQGIVFSYKMFELCRNRGKMLEACHVAFGCLGLIQRTGLKKYNNKKLILFIDISNASLKLNNFAMLRYAASRALHLGMQMKLLTNNQQFQLIRNLSTACKEIGKFKEAFKVAQKGSEMLAQCLHFSELNTMHTQFHQITIEIFHGILNQSNLYKAKNRFVEAYHVAKQGLEMLAQCNNDFPDLDMIKKIFHQIIIEIFHGILNLSNSYKKDSKLKEAYQVAEQGLEMLAQCNNDFPDLDTMQKQFLDTMKTQFHQITIDTLNKQCRNNLEKKEYKLAFDNALYGLKLSSNNNKIPFVFYLLACISGAKVKNTSIYNVIYKEIKSILSGQYPEKHKLILLLHLSNACCLLGKNDEAISLINEALSLDCSNYQKVDFHKTLAVIYNKKECFEEACLEAKKGLALIGDENTPEINQLKTLLREEQIIAEIALQNGEIEGGEEESV